MPRAPKRTVGTKDLARRWKMTEKQIRQVIRSIYNDGVYTRYKWAEDDPALSKITAAMKTRADRRGLRRKAVVTSKGQLVIPVAIRRRYHIRKGTEVHIEEVDGAILVRPITDQSIEQVRGILAGGSLPARVEKDPDRDLG